MTAKHLEKWWIEWDPTNKWVQGKFKIIVICYIYKRKRRR